MFHPSSVGDDNIIRHFHGLILVVGNEDTGDAKFMDGLSEPSPKFLANLGVDGGKRLVQQEKPRTWCQSPGKCHALPLPAR